MKKKIAISSIVVAILVVLVAGAIPHHHHDNGAICFHVKEHHLNHHHHATEDEYCDHDHDEYDNHDAHDCHHDATCIAEDNYYVHAENKIKIQTPSFENGDHFGHIQLFPLLYLVPDFLINPAYNTYTKPKQGEYLLFYKSAEVSRFHGLRAPPFTLS